MSNCRKCQKECSVEFSFCPLCGEVLQNKKFTENNEREKWELLRDKITLAFCFVILTGFVSVCCYVLLNANSFPGEIRWSIVTLMSLVILAFVGQITRTPSIKHAVATAIGQLFLRSPTVMSENTKRDKIDIIGNK